LVWAERCHVEFEQAVIRPQDIEDNGNDALKLLAERYAAIAQLIANGKYPPRHRVASTFPLPCTSKFTGHDDPSTTAGLEALATRVTYKTHTRVTCPAAPTLSNYSGDGRNPGHNQQPKMQTSGG
jgi:hypothetical protein